MDPQILHMDPQQLGSFLTSLMALVGGIWAIIKQQTAKKETQEIRLSVEDMIQVHESTKNELLAHIAQLTARDEGKTRELGRLREEIAKCESDGARTRAESAQYRSEAQILTATNTALMARLAGLTDDVEELTQTLRSKTVGLL